MKYFPRETFPEKIETSSSWEMCNASFRPWNTVKRGRGGGLMPLNKIYNNHQFFHDSTNAKLAQIVTWPLTIDVHERHSVNG